MIYTFKNTNVYISVSQFSYKRLELLKFIGDKLKMRIGKTERRYLIRLAVIEHFKESDKDLKQFSVGVATNVSRQHVNNINRQLLKKGFVKRPLLGGHYVISQTGGKYLLENCLDELLLFFEYVFRNESYLIKDKGLERSDRRKRIKEEYNYFLGSLLRWRIQDFTMNLSIFKGIDNNVGK